MSQGLERGIIVWFENVDSEELEHYIFRDCQCGYGGQCWRSVDKKERLMRRCWEG